MEKGPYSRKKIISIRRHLPLPVRVHYDAVRNFAPIKAFGMGIMVLIGIFGILLATQTISPGTSANPANDVTVVKANSAVTVHKVNEDGARLILSIQISGSSHSLQSVSPVKYRRLTSQSASSCPTSNAGWTAAAKAGDGSMLSAGRYQVPIAGFRGANYYKTICVSVATTNKSAPPHDPNRDIVGYYAVKVNRSAPNVALRITLSASSPEQLAGSNTWRYTFEANQSTYWQHSILKQTESCSGNFSVSAKVARQNYRVNVSRADDGKQICIRAKRKNAPASEVTYVSESISLPKTHSPLPVVNIDYRDRRSSGGSVTYTARNANGFVTVSQWLYIFVARNSDCSAYSFLKPGTLQWRDEVNTGKVWTPSRAELSNPPARLICFAAGTASNDWGYSTMVINVETSQPQPQPQPQPVPQPRQDTTPPRIAVTAGSASQTFKATDDDSSPTVWHYIFINGSAGCSVRTSFAGASAYTEGRDVTYFASDDGKKICFRSRDAANNAGYGASAPINIADTTAPKVSVTAGSASQTFKATDDDSEATTWHYVFIDGSAGCDGLTSFGGASAYVEGGDVAYTENNHGEKICFRSRDTANNAGYGASAPIDLPPEEEKRQEAEESVERRDTEDAAAAGSNGREEISATGGDEEGSNWSRIAGYLLIAGAILGIARILIVKKYRQMG